MQAIWDGIREGMGFILAFFYGIIPNAGFAIIMLTVLVRLILFPLTAKQAKSMIAMQRAQPEMKKLQAKYKNDRQKLNEEMMKFYKENQINPLGGCLPLLAQMPVFIALYQTLRNIQHFIPTDSKMFRDICGGLNEHACGGKLHPNLPDLNFFGMNLAKSASDVKGGIGSALPYFVLVGLVVVSAFFQQRQTMRNQTQANPQMQVIGKVMPLVFGMISINIPAGVVLYFLTSNLWQIGQQEVVFRTIGTAAGPPAGKQKTIEAKSSEASSPKPGSGGVKGLFRSLQQPPDAPGAGEQNGAPPEKPSKSGKPSKPATSGGASGAKPDQDSGGKQSSPRRRNNRKRKR